MRYGRMGGNGRNPEIRAASTFARVSSWAEAWAEMGASAARATSTHSVPMIPGLIFDCTSAREKLSHARKAL